MDIHIPRIVITVMMKHTNSDISKEENGIQLPENRKPQNKS